MSLLTLFSEVARPLLPAEVDANFAGLDSRLRDMERDGVRSVGIRDIAFSDIGGTVLITLTDGQTIGPINLPTTFFVPRGAWVTGTAYRQRDFVTVGGSSYVCRGPHTASADFATDLGNSLWQINAAQGKDGEPFATFVGVYDAAHAYAPGDMVLFDSGTGYLLYRLAFAASAGTAPGTLQSGTPIPYWTLQSNPPTVQTTEICQQGQGRPVPSSQQLRRRIARRTRFPVDFAGSYAVLSGGQATAVMSFDILQNGQKIGAISIPAASRTGTFSTVDRTNGPLLLPGDALVVILRTDLDGSASDLDLTLLGTVG